jgi:hypothetical protein
MRWYSQGISSIRAVQTDRIRKEEFITAIFPPSQFFGIPAMLMSNALRIFFKGRESGTLQAIHQKETHHLPRCGLPYPSILLPKDRKFVKISFEANNAVVLKGKKRRPKYEVLKIHSSCDNRVYLFLRID